jgi:hypothetical protein
MDDRTDSPFSQVPIEITVSVGRPGRRCATCCACAAMRC